MYLQFIFVESTCSIQISIEFNFSPWQSKPSSHKLYIAISESKNLHLYSLSPSSSLRLIAYSMFLLSISPNPRNPPLLSLEFFSTASIYPPSTIQIAKYLSMRQNNLSINKNNRERIKYQCTLIFIHQMDVIIELLISLLIRINKIFKNLLISLHTHLFFI